MLQPGSPSESRAGLELADSGNTAHHHEAIIFARQMTALPLPIQPFRISVRRWLGVRSTKPLPLLQLRRNPGTVPAGSYQIQKATPKDGRCISGFGVGADVQQIRVIAVVMITVLLGSANSYHSPNANERQNPLKTDIEMQGLGESMNHFRTG